MASSEYVTVKIANEEMRLPVGDNGQTLLELLRDNDIVVSAPCGGNGTCKQCKVSVNGEEVLACQTAPQAGMVVVLPETGNERILTDHMDIPKGGKGLGLAVDIGTTTTAVYIYDLEAGICLRTKGAMNAQRAYGADVISRIQHAGTPQGLAELRDVIRQQIMDMARELCPDLGDITYVSIAGNTVMEHLFAGLDPTGIGVAPFTPLSLFGEEYPASDYLEGFSPDCRLYMCPAVAGYVGGDITAGLLSSGAAQSEREVLFIDVGTNGEMAMGDRNGLACCATAAGPAFEGAEIECGSMAQDGAINTVADDLTFTVLGDTEAKSICGSGLIDAVAALLRNEILDETGLLEEEQYMFNDRVYISRKDIRNLQLAKAAIRAGIETLLKIRKASYEEINEVLIAGGFGAYMNVKSACTIGLLPPGLINKTRYVGNSAGKGASMALTPEGRAELKVIAEKCMYEELSSSSLFNGEYINAMMFDEWEEVEDD
ncbi:MAG: DUF4445 domain-containing protein [Lachnospiraceae bacterium]|nr:DUF4445 domain-containing protein [Lachnospiraceae bacterium]